MYISRVVSNTPLKMVGECTRKKEGSEKLKKGLGRKKEVMER
jgi:hypothetical protein